MRLQRMTNTHFQIFQICLINLVIGNTTLDLTFGFHQIEIDPKDVPKSLSFKTDRVGNLCTVMAKSSGRPNLEGDTG